MRSRLEDLIVTADLQLASRSFDAAVDTLRTALGEPGAAEAGVAGRLEGACLARDEARGIVRPAPMQPIAEVAPIAVEPIAEVQAAPMAVGRIAEVQVAPIAVELIAEVQVSPMAVGRIAEVQAAPIAVEPIAEVQAAPAAVERLAEVQAAPMAVEPIPEVRVAPAPQPVLAPRPIEAPRFLLVEDNPSMLERPGRERQPLLDVERLSILDPTQPREPEREIDLDKVTRMIVALGIFILVCGLAFFLR
jgi:hypothetical protein